MMQDSINARIKRPARVAHMDVDYSGLLPFTPSGPSLARSKLASCSFVFRAPALHPFGAELSSFKLTKHYRVAGAPLLAPAALFSELLPFTPLGPLLCSVHVLLQLF